MSALKRMIRKQLLADDTLNAKVKGRVYSAHLMDADAKTVDYPCMVFEFISGNARWHGGVQVQVFELYAYSKQSADEAAQVYDLAMDTLHHERMTLPAPGGGPLDASGVAFEVQRPVEGYNAKVHAWWARGRWQANAT